MRFATACKTAMVLFLVFMGAAAAKAQAENLPKRTSPKPYTSSHVPHVQVGVEPVPELSKELLRKVSRIPGVEIRNSVMSLPGALGFRLAKDVALTRPDLGVRGREFAHMHPDGSLHAFLSPALAIEAVNAGWAAHHPWSKKWPKWKGFVMLYTPMSKSELEVVLQLVKESYNLVTAKP